MARTQRSFVDNPLFSKYFLFLHDSLDMHTLQRLSLQIWHEKQSWHFCFLIALAIFSGTKIFPLILGIVTKVIKIISTGVLLDLGDNITGLIKKEKIPVKTTYKEGQEVNVTVSSVDKKKHRVEVAPVLTAKPIGYR